MTFLKLDNAVLVFAWVIQNLHCRLQLIGNTCCFVEGLNPLLNGTLNICRHGKVFSTKKAYKRRCSHFDQLDAMKLSLKA